MDETNKQIIAYAAMFSGMPILGAQILWFVPGTISSKLLAPVSRQLDQIVNEVCHGFISLLLACLLFEHLGLKVVHKIPVILTIVNLVWKSEIVQAVPFLVGAITGFALYPKVSLLFPRLFFLSPL